MRTWDHKIQVGDLFAAYHQTGNLPAFVEAIDARLRPVAEEYADGTDDTLVEILEELDTYKDDASDPYVEELVSDMYDFADTYGIWLDPSEEVAQ